MSRAAQSTAGAVRLDAGDTLLVMHNPTGHFRVELDTGRMEFVAVGGRQPRRLPAEAFVGFERGRAPATECQAPLRWRHVEPSHGAAVSVEFSRAVGDDACLHWRVEAKAGGFIVRVGVSGAREPVTGLGLLFPARESFLAAASRPHALQIAFCGAHSRSPLSRSEVVPLKPTTSMCSWWTTAWFDAGDEAGFVLGYLEARRFAGRFNLTEGAWMAHNLIERNRPANGAILWSEPLWIAPTGNVCDALRDYGGQVGRVCGRTGVAESPWGWGSWTHFADSMDAPRVLVNARMARELGVISAAAPLIHVDHGWEEQFRTHRPKSSWEPRHEFTHSVRRFAQNLQEGGARFGLWVVPFAINTDGPVSPAWRAAVLQDSAGNPQPVIGTGCYCVDPTSPAGEAWLRRLFAKLAGWGASQFKLDFLRVLVADDPDDTIDGLAQPRRFHRAMTRLEAYRHGLGIIRDVVGPQVQLLACGAPLLPSAGLVDSCRIGSDIEVAWEHGRTGIRFCAENVRCNFFWHGQVWRNDPDFLVVPADGRLFRHWATAVAFAGGPALVSADLPKLTRQQCAELSRFLPALPGESRPLGLAPRGRGVRICQTMSLHGETVWLVAFFNRGERAHKQSISLDELDLVPAGPGLAWDVLSSRCHGRPGRSWSVAVPPRDVRILCLRMALGRPHLLGTSGHVGMEQMELAGVTWNTGLQELRCERHRARPWPERIYFRVPQPFCLTLTPGLSFDRRSRIGVAELKGTRSRAVSFSFMSKQ